MNKHAMAYRLVTAALVGILVFAACMGLTSGVRRLGWSTSPVTDQLWLKLALIVISGAIFAVLRRPWSEFGLVRPRWGRGDAWWFVLAAVAMAVVSMVMVLLGERHPLARELSFLQIVLVVWLLSSVAEEVFVRGLVQGLATPGGAGGARTGRLLPPVVLSAAFFAAMHVPLVWRGAGVRGGLIIVATMFVVGWAAAELRARTGSLLPAVLAHIGGNVAGVPGGILGVVIYRLVHGQMPDLTGG